jgi:hypothetical protein
VKSIFRVKVKAEVLPDWAGARGVGNRDREIFGNDEENRIVAQRH